MPVSVARIQPMSVSIGSRKTANVSPMPRDIRFITKARMTAIVAAWVRPCPVEGFKALIPGPLGHSPSFPEPSIDLQRFQVAQCGKQGIILRPLCFRRVVGYSV